MKIEDILIFIFCLFNFYLALSAIFVLFKVKNILFFSLINLLNIYFILNSLIDISKSNQVALTLSKILFSVSSLLPFSLIAFTSSFHKNSKISVILIFNIFSVIAGVVFIYFSLFTDFIIKGTDVSVYPVYLDVGKFYVAFNVFMIIEVLYVFILLFYIRRRLIGLDRLQFEYFTLGALIAACAILITNAIFPMLGITKFVRMPGIISVIFTLTTTNAILKHKLFSIKTLLLNIIKYFIFGVILFSIVLVLRVIKDKLFHVGQYSYEALLIDLVVAILVASTFENIVNRLDSFLGKFIKPEIVYLNNLIKNLEKGVLRELDLEDVIKTTHKRLQASFNNLKIYYLYKNSDYKTYPKLELSENEIESIKKIDKIYIKQEMEIHFDKRKLLNIRNDFSIIANITRDVFIIFTEKFNKEAFTRIELDVIEESVELLRGVFSRVEIFEQTKSFNLLLQKKVEQATYELKKKILALQELRRRERDMIDIMGHELRTPLSIVKSGFGFLNMYFEKNVYKKLDQEAKEKIMKYFERIDENIEREIKLLDNMLGATRLDKGKLELNLEPVDMIDVIEDGIVGQRKHAFAKNLYIVFNKPKDAENFPKAWADRARTQEVMDNLLSNAVKYTNAGGVTVDIEHNKKEIIIHVKDTGVGIPENERQNLGKKFYRINQYTEGSKDRELKIVRAGGTGLGLYVTFGIVQAQGGKIWVDSKVGKGSTFHFTVPIFTGQNKQTESKEVDLKDMFKRQGLNEVFVIRPSNLLQSPYIIF